MSVKRGGVGVGVGVGGGGWGGVGGGVGGVLLVYLYEYFPLVLLVYLYEYFPLPLMGKVFHSILWFLWISISPAMADELFFRAMTQLPANIDWANSAWTKEAEDLMLVCEMERTLIYVPKMYYPFCLQCIKCLVFSVWSMKQHNSY